MKAKRSYKGIPSKEVKGLRTYMRIMEIASPQVAYKRLLETRRALAEKKTKDEAANAAEAAKRERRYKAEAAKDAKETVKEAVANVAVLRDLLGRVEDGSDKFHCVEDTVHVINCALKLNMRNMERALMTLGVIPSQVALDEEGKTMVSAGYWQDE